MAAEEVEDRLTLAERALIMGGFQEAQAHALIDIAESLRGVHEELVKGRLG